MSKSDLAALTLLRSGESLVFFLPGHPGIVQAVGQVYG